MSYQPQQSGVEGEALAPLTPPEASQPPRTLEQSQLPSEAEGKRLTPFRWRRGALLAVLLVNIPVAIWFWGIRETRPNSDLGRFQGDWQVTVGGRETANLIRVSGDRWQYLTGNTAGNTFEGKVYRLTLNTTANPREIELELIDEAGRFKGPKVKMHGIYVLDSKTARVALVPAIEPRPTSLDDPDSPALELIKVRLETPGQSRR
jgi:uncharacterized protein (TIGR03067 family)